MLMLVLVLGLVLHKMKNNERISSRAQFLKRFRRTEFFPFLLRDPHVFFIGHDVCQDGAAEEDHVSSPGRIFYSDFEFLEGVLALSKQNLRHIRGMGS